VVCVGADLHPGNITEKGELRAACARLPGLQLGRGVGFYVDTEQEPWAKHFGMPSYIEQELPALTSAHVLVGMMRQGITVPRWVATVRPSPIRGLS